MEGGECGIYQFTSVNFDWRRTVVEKADFRIWTEGRRLSNKADIQIVLVHDIILEQGWATHGQPDVCWRAVNIFEHIKPITHYPHGGQSF